MAHPFAAQPQIAAQPRQVSSAGVAFAAMWLIIGLVSAYDIYLAVKFGTVLRDYERNPIGQLLMQIDQGSIALFMGCKSAGTVIVLGALLLLRQFKERIGLLVATGVVICQLYLAWYLTFADYRVPQP